VLFLKDFDWERWFKVKVIRKSSSLDGNFYCNRYWNFNTEYEVDDYLGKKLREHGFEEVSKGRKKKDE